MESSYKDTKGEERREYQLPKDLIAEIEKTAVSSQAADVQLGGLPPFPEKAAETNHGGNYAGTYVVKDLVYAYAMT